MFGYLCFILFSLSTEFFKSLFIRILAVGILLHYVFEKLAKILILHTFRDVKMRFSHGMTYFGRQGVPIGTPVGSEPITIKILGLFQCFHDCYSIDPSVYMQVHEPQFTLKDVIDAGKVNYLELEYAVNYGGTNSYKIEDQETGNKITINELDREFIFIYAISTLVRYRVREWDSIIAGKNTDLIIKIRQYLQSIEILFPNLILNELYGTTLSFYSPARSGDLE
jgi:hypothetical protein